jgi:hypothetical protein
VSYCRKTTELSLHFRKFIRPGKKQETNYIAVDVRAWLHSEQRLGVIAGNSFNLWHAARLVFGEAVCGTVSVIIATDGY